MNPSSFHRGDFDRLRRNLTIALLEAQAMEPRAQLAYSREEVPADFAAGVSLLRLLLERADAVTRIAIDVSISDTQRHFDVYSATTYSDRQLAGGGETIDTP